MILRGRDTNHRHEIGGSGAGHQPANRLDAPTGVLHVVDQELGPCLRRDATNTGRRELEDHGPQGPLSRRQRPLDPVLPHSAPSARDTVQLRLHHRGVGRFPIDYVRRHLAGGDLLDGAQDALTHDPLAFVRPAERMRRDDDVFELQNRDRSDRPVPARRRPSPPRRYAGPAVPRTARPDRRAGRGPC